MHSNFQVVHQAKEIKLNIYYTCEPYLALEDAVFLSPRNLIKLLKTKQTASSFLHNKEKRKCLVSEFLCLFKKYI